MAGRPVVAKPARWPRRAAVQSETCPPPRADFRANRRTETPVPVRRLGVLQHEPNGNWNRSPIAHHGTVRIPGRKPGGRRVKPDHHRKQMSYRPVDPRAIEPPCRTIGRVERVRSAVRAASANHHFLSPFDGLLCGLLARRTKRSFRPREKVFSPAIRNPIACGPAGKNTPFQIPPSPFGLPQYSAQEKPPAKFGHCGNARPAASPEFGHHYSWGLTQPTMRKASIRAASSESSRLRGKP
jgi:hypothetical protein